jgi:UDP-N-acetylglucosamine--N-acetylmuramyl-(pentapeptide) pyrophosphoryl-undecaprenol N-acetylglucosamine transferase
MLRREAVDVVIGTGGRASVPVAVAARSLGLPLCLLEQNAVPGRANRWLARLAARIWLGLPAARPLARAVVTGTPLRSDVGRRDRTQARESLGLLADVPVVLVFGGSQGAAVLNEVVPAATALVRRPLQVVHLTGLERDRDVRLAYDAGPAAVTAIVRPLAKDMAALYAAADLVVCRGGGSTLAELIAAGRPAIIVPYPHHHDRQQWHNGQVLARAGAGLVLEQDACTAPALAAVIGRLLADPGRLAAMGERARGLVPGDACARILDDLAGLEGA